MPKDPALEQLNLEQWWPELFEGLDARRRRGVRNALASSCDAVRRSEGF